MVVLFWVSFWLIARLEHERWMEFLKARVWTAVSLGSTASLVLIGFTAVYREGFETALFYEALLSFGTGPRLWIAARLRGSASSRSTIVSIGDLPARTAPAGEDVPLVRGDRC